MELSITQVPAWVSISFALFFATVPVLLIANAAKAALIQGNQPNAFSIKKNIIYFYALYFLVVGVIALSGFFIVNTLPPRVFVTTVIPLFLFYLVVVQRMSWFKIALEHIRLEQLILIHLFRFVGIYFFLVNIYGSLPYRFAMIGGTGDILTAILAIPVLYALRNGYRYAKTLAWAWNIFGLLDILLVLINAITITWHAITNNEAGVQQFGSFPFCWIPAFAPATIIFLHIVTFRKLLGRQ